MCICVYFFMYYINIGVSIQESMLNNLFNGYQDQGFTVCCKCLQTYEISALNLNRQGREKYEWKQ